MRRWRSGQSQQTVNLSPSGLRGFESLPAHNVKFHRKISCGILRLVGARQLLVSRGDSKGGAMSSLRDERARGGTTQYFRNTWTKILM